MPGSQEGLFLDVIPSQTPSDTPTPTKKRKVQKYHNYNREDIANAINLILQKGCSIRKASNVYNVPRTTLASYLKSATKDSTFLKRDEEVYIFNWMTECCKLGFRIRQENVIKAVDGLIKGQGRENPFSDNDEGKRNYKKFADKWLLNNTKADRKYLNMAIPDWYHHIESFLIEKDYYEILSYPSRLFICDEYRFIRRSNSEAIKQSLKKSEILYTMSAAGDLLPPLMVYPYASEIPKQIIKAAPKDYHLMTNEEGKIDWENFYNYLLNVFHKYLVQNQVEMPVILFIDDNLVPLTIEITNLCKNNDIILVALHDSIIKPTKHVFGSLDNGWRDEVKKWEKVNKQKFTLIEFCGLTSIINQRYIDGSLLMRGFSESGLFPWAGSLSGADPDMDNEIEDLLESVDNEEDDGDDDVTTDNGFDGDPEITLKLYEFKKMIGKTLLSRFNQYYDTQDTEPFQNHAENVLFHMYKQFNCQNIQNDNDEDDDDDIVLMNT